MTWEYIAGFFDGEGCIHKTKKGIYFVSCSQSEHQHDVIFEIKSFLESNGVTSSVRTYQNLSSLKTVHKRKTTCLSFTNRNSVFSFLNNVLPFLIVKREKAILAIESAKSTIERREKQKLKPRKAYLLYCEGYSSRNISKMLKMSPADVLKSVRSNGGSPRRTRRYNYSNNVATMKNMWP